MQSDPLQQLRDVHSPADPSWWPPAPGWWLLAALAAAFIIWILWRAWRNWRHRAPIRMGERLHREYAQALATGEISAADYLHRCNELIKRILVRSYNHYKYAPLSGEPWLQALDQLSASNDFTAGPGRALGDNRFAANPEVNTDQLGPIITKAIKAAVHAT